MCGRVGRSFCFVTLHFITKYRGGGGEATDLREGGQQRREDIGSADGEVCTYGVVAVYSLKKKKRRR